MREIIADVLDRARQKGATVKDGDLAKYLLDFERQKRDRSFNYGDIIRRKKTIQLHVQDGPQLRVDLNHKQIKQIFETAFEKGLEVLKHEMKSVLSNSKDIVVLFTGGSYLSRGLRDQVEDIMQDFQTQVDELNTADREVEIKFNYGFLGNIHTRHW